MSSRACLLSICAYFLAATSLSFAAEPVVLATGDTAKGPKQPQVAVSEDGVVHVAYGAGDTVYHCRSDDGGKTYSAPTETFRCPNLSLGMRRGPRIAASGKTVVITAIGGAQGKGRDGDLQAWRITDKDQKWTGPVAVNDVMSAAREGLHSLAAAPDGSMWCTWLDLRSDKSEVYAAQSKDHGETWTPNLRVYRSPDGSVCECCHPSIAIGPKGEVHVLFRNSLGGKRDMYLATSKDGKTFTPAKKLGTGSWNLDACPMDGGMLAVNAKGEVVTAWRRQNGIFTTVGTSGKETSLGQGEQPFVTTTPSGSLTVWTSRRGGDLWMQTGTVKRTTKLAADATDPAVAASPKKGGPVVCCWESSQNGKRSVVAQRID